MTSWQATSEDSPAGADGAFRVVGLAAVCIGVAALAAATFVLSYQGIRAVALQAGIEPRYARGYPLLIDAMLVIVLAAVLALRGAGVPSRMLSWLTLLIVLGAAAGADTLHATGRTLPHNTAVITAAVLPWALVFVAFVLLLAMLRHARLRRHARTALIQPTLTRPVANGQAVSQQDPTVPAPSLPVRAAQSWQSDSVSIVPGFSSQLVSSAAAGAAAGAAAVAVEPSVHDDTDRDSMGADAEPGAESAEDVGDVSAVLGADSAPAPQQTDLAGLDVEAAVQADEAETEDGEPELQAAEPQPQTAEPEPQAAEPEPPAVEPELQASDPEVLAGEPDLPAGDAQTQSAEHDDEMPMFHRIRSEPTPPEG